MRLLLALILLLSAPVFSEAATIAAASCNNTVASPHVQNAINSATSGTGVGDTVTVPAGTCAWTSTVTFSGKSIKIQGAGRSPDRASCTPSQTTYTCISGLLKLIDWTTIATGNDPVGLSEITGFTFDSPAGAVNCSTYGSGMLVFNGVSMAVHVHHNTILYEGCWGISMKRASGVIDHNIVYAYKGFQHFLTAMRTGSAGTDTYGDESWNRASSQGGASNVFVEDNTFTADPSIVANGVAAFTDHLYGGRAVHRFNTFVDGGVQAHGTESGGRTRSYRHMETYRNAWSWSGPNAASITSFRGATGKLFDNAVTGTMSRFAGLNTFRAGPTSGDPTGYPWALCLRQIATSITSAAGIATVTVPLAHGIQPLSGAGSTPKAYMTISGADQSEYNGVGVKATKVTSTSFTYPITGSPASPATGTILVGGAFDGNTDTKGYPCIDQVGAGTGDLLSGDGPETANQVTPVGWPNQALDPAYCFNNQLNGSTVNDCGAVPQGSDVIIENRDFYNQKASFNGTSVHGIGRGTRAQRDAAAPSASLNDAWWSTDQGGNWNTSTTETYSALVGLTSGADGCLDVWRGSAWVDCYYTPYTYPHPLVSATVPPAANAPGNLRIIGASTGASCTIVWTASDLPNLVGYRIYWGTSTGVYTHNVNKTSTGWTAAHQPPLQHTFQFPQAATNYITVTAYSNAVSDSAAATEITCVSTGLSRTAAPSRSPRP